MGCGERIERAVGWPSTSDRVPFEALHGESRIRVHSEPSASSDFKSVVGDKAEEPAPIDWSNLMRKKNESVPENCQYPKYEWE